MRGVKGFVTLTQASQGQPISVTTALTGLTQSNTMVIREVRVHYDGSSDMCSAARLGPQYGSFSGTVPSSWTSSSNIADVTDLRLFNRWAKEQPGRSVVLTDTSNASAIVCATLESSESHITAIAKFPSSIAGTVILRQASSPENAATSVCVDLFRVMETDNSTVETLGWDLYSSPVPADTTNTELSRRCTNIGNVETDLTTRHGRLSASLQKGQNVNCFVDLNLNVQSAIGKTLAIKSSDGSIVSCGTVRLVMKRNTLTRISRDGVKGVVKMSQDSMYDPTRIEVNITGLQSVGGGYHIHEWPVPQKLETAEAVCDPSHVAGHFNPNNIVVSNFPSAGTGTVDQYEIGDISGKFGLLTGKTELIAAYTDAISLIDSSNDEVSNDILSSIPDAEEPYVHNATVGQFETDVV
uniref:Uncharacterized protein LOC111114322 n=1 Tax=Crassostrea virginica TaxID=6565 RepID=A0A8B8BYD7_CRAVI|nr:uncharacterized protein LOC111114322 [Crassostrea virginica]